MPYNFVADSFHTKKLRNFLANFFNRSAILGATYDGRLRLVGKRVGDFLLVLIELVSLGRTAEALRAIIG